MVHAKQANAALTLLAAALWAQDDLTTPATVLPDAAGSIAAEMRLREARVNGENYISLKSPVSLAGNVSLTLPSALGTSGSLLYDLNGTGALALATEFLYDTNRGTRVNTWSGVSAGVCGQALFSNNAYINQTDNAIKALNTHVGIGAAGVYLGICGDTANHIAFLQAAGATTADANLAMTVIAKFDGSGHFLINRPSDATSRYILFDNTAGTAGDWQAGTSITTSGSFQIAHNGIARLSIPQSAGVTISGSGLTVDSGYNIASPVSGYQVGGTVVINSARHLENIAGVATNLTPTSDGTRSLGTSTLRYLGLEAATVVTRAASGSTQQFSVTGTTIFGINSSGASSISISNSTGDVLAYGNIAAGVDGIGVFTSQGATGLTQSVTVRNAAGDGTCTLIFTGGIKTGGTC